MSIGLCWPYYVFVIFYPPYLLKLYFRTGNLWSEPVFEVIWYHFGFVYSKARFFSWFHTNPLPPSRMRRERRTQHFGARIEFLCVNLFRQKAQISPLPENTRFLEIAFVIKREPWHLRLPVQSRDSGQDSESLSAQIELATGGHFHRLSANCRGWSDTFGTPDPMRASYRFWKDLSLDIPRDWFIEMVFETKEDKYDPIGNLKEFPDSQDHPDHHGSLLQVPKGPEPGHPQWLIFWDSFWYQSRQVWSYW